MQGAQEPRICTYPEYDFSLGDEAIELAATAGLVLDPWQEMVVRHALGRANNQWAAFEVGVTVPRQNGKGGILEALELGGLFLFEEELIIHSAHEFKTAREAFRRLKTLIRRTPDLERRVERYSHSHADFGIELKTGQRILYATRTSGAGRGFTGNRIIYDEDMALTEDEQGATVPTLSTVDDPQVVYTGSAVDQMNPKHVGIAKARLRERAIAGNDPSLAYFEWSVDADSPDDVSEAAMVDPQAWADANPAFGIRISEDYIGRERRALGPRQFVVERLNVGDWPDPEAFEGALIPGFADLADADSEPDRAKEWAFDVSPSFSKAAIGLAGRRKRGGYHVEVVEHRAGTTWLVDRICELVETHRIRAVTCDERGPAASFIPALRERRVKVHTVNGSEYARACGQFYDACGVEDDDEPALAHRGDAPLINAVAGAAQRPLGDAWAWSRKNSSVDITPLVACTLALHRAARPERTGRVMA